MSCCTLLLLTTAAAAAVDLVTICQQNFGGPYFMNRAGDYLKSLQGERYESS
jgi:hypothetical protein